MKFLNILLAPLFVVLLHYFELRMVILLYLCISIIFLIYRFFKRKTYKDILLPSMYIIAFSIAYHFSSLQTVKYIPVILSTIFLFLFVDSHFNKKYMILNFTKKFYRKKLKEEEIKFLENGDAYWIVVMLINTIIHLYIVNFSSNEIWAFYSSIGWYILFFISLIIQIIYGKTYAVKMYTR